MSVTRLIPMPIRQVVRFGKRWARSHIPWCMNPPPPGKASLKSWRSVRPIRRNFGWETGGQCVDRYFIEGFLEQNKSLIRGRVLEVAENKYTMRFGGAQVTRSEILHVKEGSPDATIIGDLVSGKGIPDDAFDCVILTQVLFSIYDVRAAVRTIYRMLAPGGTLLLTDPGISQVCRYDMQNWGDCWRFTSDSATRLFSEVFPPDHFEVQTKGNVLTCIAFLHGLLASELKPHELDHHDPDYQMSILVKARKPDSRS